MYTRICASVIGMGGLRTKRAIFGGFQDDDVFVFARARAALGCGSNQLRASRLAAQNSSASCVSAVYYNKRARCTQAFKHTIYALLTDGYMA